MQTTRRPTTRVLHAPERIYVVTVGLGLAYLAMLAGFALAFDRPSALGWGGFGVVVAAVLAITIGIGPFLMRGGRGSR